MLIAHSESQGFEDCYDEKTADLLHGAEQSWRRFLLKEAPNPGAFRLHLVPFYSTFEWGSEWPPNMNRYTMRTIQIDLCGGEHCVYTCVKLPRFMIFGHVMEADPSCWRGTKVNANGGIVMTSGFQLPMGLMGYIKAKAQGVIDAMSEISERQNLKIQAAITSNAASIAGSDFFNAMNADLENFGVGAFISDIKG
ncbi:hypothetical protein FE772_19630 [Lysobacter enzymogenes]|nr:hypothetical protein [Lysobacter enzymogenes]QCW27520.1 hypothetical protein FE772_19630 [Lysobacter enzymogenes]